MIARRFAAGLVAGGLLLTGCSSSGTSSTSGGSTSSSGSGGGSGSTSAVAAQLEKDPSTSGILKELPSDKKDAVANCIAKAYSELYPQSELNAFASGKKKLIQLTPKANANSTKAEEDATNCAKSLGG